MNFPPIKRSRRRVPADRAFWEADPGQALPLIYLAWGRRYFGDWDMTIKRRMGWTYSYIAEGAPTLVVDGRPHRVRAGSLAITGPDIAYGWNDDGKNSCRMIGWEWREPVGHGLLTERDVFLRLLVPASARTQLRRLFDLTRGELGGVDEHSADALGGVKTIFGATVARLFGVKKSETADDHYRQAVAWLTQNLKTRQPLARLADYLATSPSSVHRLFRDRGDGSVLDVVTQLRTDAALRLLSSGGRSIKEIAYELGYDHPNDFSRAFRKRTGRAPHEWLAQRGSLSSSTADGLRERATSVRARRG